MNSTDRFVRIKSYSGKFFGWGALDSSGPRISFAIDLKAVTAHRAELPFCYEPTIGMDVCVEKRYSGWWGVPTYLPPSYLGTGIANLMMRVCVGVSGGGREVWWCTDVFKYVSR